jgi:hypothetical protein
METAASGTLLDRILRELEKTKLNRRDVAEGLIHELRSRQLVTPSEATNLTKFLELIDTNRVIDAALVKKIVQLAKRFHSPDSVAGTIANTTARVARAIQTARPAPAVRRHR